MASFNIGRLTLDLVVKTAALVMGMDRAERAVKSAKEKILKQWRELREQANKTGKVLAGIGAGFAAYGAKEIGIEMCKDKTLKIVEALERRTFKLKR